MIGYQKVTKIIGMTLSLDKAEDFRIDGGRMYWDGREFVDLIGYFAPTIV
jgi:hypothetical protein